MIFLLFWIGWTSIYSIIFSILFSRLFQFNIHDLLALNIESGSFWAVMGSAIFAFRGACTNYDSLIAKEKKDKLWT